MVIFFLNGLFFGSLGLAAYLQIRQGTDFPLKKHLPWLAAFGFVSGATSWVEMFSMSGVGGSPNSTLAILGLILHPLTGLCLLKFGWGVFRQMSPLPPWMNFIPGILIVPLAYVITYAATTFITPSPIEIPIDIWSRYLLYLPGSVLAGAGFLRQWYIQRKGGFNDVAGMMLGAGMAFLFEAIVVGLIVPATPYAPASYYNYDRVVHNAFVGEQSVPAGAFGLSAWLDYERVLNITGLPVEFWRMVSGFAVTFFVVKGLDVFEAIRKRKLAELQEERDQAQEESLQNLITARKTAEEWTDGLVAINRQITQLENVDTILLEIIKMARNLLHSDFVGLGLLNEDRSKMMLKCHCYDNHLEMIETSMVVGNPLILKSMQSNQTYRSQPDVPLEMLENAVLVQDKTARSIAIVPLELDNQSIGALWIVRCKEDSDFYSATDLIWLEYLADQIVIAIQHGLMTSKMQSSSIVEERARIAREMHDGLAQVLGYLNLQVQTLQALEQQGKNEELQIELKHMRQAIQNAHADVRENILSLRTTLANEKSLVSAMGEYLDEFSIQTGLKVQFTDDTNGELNIASIAEVQLICILKEALANVRKHANATRVDIRLSKNERDETDYICMEVVDDGKGFVLRGAKRRFGLLTMRERASDVQGIFEINSSSGSGTSISCWLPCLQPEQMEKRSVVLS